MSAASQNVRFNAPFATGREFSNGHHASEAFCASRNSLLPWVATPAQNDRCVSRFEESASDLRIEAPFTSSNYSRDRVYRFKLLTLASESAFHLKILLDQIAESILNPSPWPHDRRYQETLDLNLVKKPNQSEQGHRSQFL